MLVDTGLTGLTHRLKRKQDSNQVRGRQGAKASPGSGLSVCGPFGTRFLRVAYARPNAGRGRGPAGERVQREARAASRGVALSIRRPRARIDSIRLRRCGLRGWAGASKARRRRSAASAVAWRLGILTWAAGMAPVELGQCWSSTASGRRLVAAASGWRLPHRLGARTSWGIERRGRFDPW